ncbi:unnamed protein product [Cylicostephanus goldi]|uniref:Uncharacterized protein n=1 Tax=Cylicostephanus goldi TaxID=71465 RepID=A0A3P6URH3_CYLGO|nr:unnamed protein product [Cylicostephanus goldi]
MNSRQGLSMWHSYCMDKKVLHICEAQNVIFGWKAIEKPHITSIHQRWVVERVTVGVL